MDELIRLTKTKIGAEDVNSVSGRELHAFLEVQTAFKDWMPRSVEDFGFTEGSDFCSFLSESTGGRPAKEYLLTIPMAKELAMVQRTEKGKQARLYFIECERKAQQNPFWAQIPKTLPAALRLCADLEDQRAELACKVQELEPKAGFADRVSQAEDGQSIGQVAKVLKTGQNTLFAWLRGRGILMPSNLPYQEHLNAGRFRVIEQVWKDGDGNEHLSTKTLVTGKGLIWIENMWNFYNSKP